MAKKELMSMNRSQDYKNAKTVLSKKEKIGQLFMPAAFINDTEEEIQALERVIVENHVGGLCFFHSRASAATNYEGKKEVIKNEQSFKTLQNLVWSKFDGRVIVMRDNFDRAVVNPHLIWPVVRSTRQYYPLLFGIHRPLLSKARAGGVDR